MDLVKSVQSIPNEVAQESLFTRVKGVASHTHELLNVSIVVVVVVVAVVA